MSISTQNGLSAEGAISSKERTSVEKIKELRSINQSICMKTEENGSHNRERLERL